MPIHRVTAGELGELEIPYGSIAAVVRDFIVKEMGPDCAAIYLYLYDKPPEWEPYQADIIKNLKGINKDRYQKAIRQLKKHGFWVADQDRKKKGQFGAKSVDFHVFPDHFLTESWNSGLAVDSSGFQGCSEADLTPEMDDIAHRKLDLPADGFSGSRIFQPQIHKELNKHKELNTHSSSDDSEAFGDIPSEVGFFKPPSEEKPINPITKAEFDSECGFILGEHHPHMWEQLNRDNWVTPKGKAIRSVDDLRNVLQGIQARRL